MHADKSLKGDEFFRLGMAQPLYTRNNQSVKSSGTKNWRMNVLSKHDFMSSQSKKSKLLFQSCHWNLGPRNTNERDSAR